MRWLSRALGGYRARLIVRFIPELGRSQDEIVQIGKRVVRDRHEIDQLGQQVVHNRQKIDQLGQQAVSIRQEIEQLGQLVVHNRQEIDQLGQQVAHNHQEIDRVGQQTVHHWQEIDRLNQQVMHNHREISEQVVHHREEIDQLASKWSATAQAEARYRKEARYRQLISSVIVQYFAMGERNEDTSIPFDDVRIDSNPDWIPEILGRSDISEPEFIIFKHFNKDLGTILDIGANYGYAAASIWAAGATSRILSFEPNPWHKPCLLRIKEMRNGLFDFIHLGLGSSDRDTRFVIPVIEGIGISALSSASIEAEIDWALPENLLQHMMHDHPTLDSPRLQFTEVIWRTERLDDVLRKYPFDIDLSAITAMKIDVEGFEADVLAGAVHTLLAHKPLIMIEGANRNVDVVACLSPIGYCYADFAIDHVILMDRPSSHSNGFFLHQEKLDYYRSMGLLRAESGDVI